MYIIATWEMSPRKSVATHIMQFISRTQIFCSRLLYFDLPPMEYAGDCFSPWKQGNWFLLRPIGPRSGGVERNELLVMRGEGVVGCPVFTLIGDGRINGMGGAWTNGILEY